MQGTKREHNGHPKLNTLPPDEQVLYTTIPFWKVPYEEQIKEKTDLAVLFILKLCQLILTRNPNLGGWVQRQQEIHGGMMCRVDQMLRTCNPNGYRAKCEFRVGIDEVTNMRVVGFQKGSKTGVVSVYPGDKMIQLPHQMKLVVKLFEDYIRMSPLPPYSPDTKNGHWHHINVRVSMAGEVMILVTMNVGNLTEQQLQYVKSDLTNYFFNGDGRVANVQSLYYHPLEEKQQNQANLELLGGIPRLVETVCGVNFLLGPFTHFMSNTCTAQSMFEAIHELVRPSPNVTVIDICSGIGAIGLTLAKKCKEVYAIEMQDQHITDGVVTAQVNGISNFSFLHGRAEEQLGDLLRSLDCRDKEIVCIFDPPKLGANKRSTLTDLAFKIVDQVRQCPAVTRFVYICNNSKGPVRLFLDFCASPLERGTYKFTGSPFVPVRIIPVDLAPHAPNYQLFILFEKCNSALPNSRKNTKKKQETRVASSPSTPAATSTTYITHPGYC